MGCAWVADLRTSKDEHWKKIGKGARSSISKAQKSAVTTRIAQGDEDLDRYYQIHCETYRRTGEAPQPREYFEGIWRHFVSTGLAVIFFAEQEGKTIAAANFAVYKKAAYYWTGASSAAGLSTGSNALLQWTAIQWMIAQGIEWYEVGPAFPYAREGKQKQISDFKKDFGGSLYPDFRGTLNTKNKIGKTLALAHDFYKQVLR
jgi:lipid II:glycine glycyltransferase (peptidoglycan interpeptide bridge formation enzyme)